MKKEHFGAGAVSATFTCILLQPLDVYKTRVQELKAESGTKFRTFGLVQSMIKGEGIGAFWKGTLPTLVRNVPGTSMYFGTFQAIKGLLLATAGDRPYDKQVVLWEKAEELRSSLGRNPFVSLHIDEDATDEILTTTTTTTSSTTKSKISSSTSMERRLVHVHYTLSDSAHLLTGGCARTFVGTLFMPITVMKVRLESSQYQYKSISDACYSIHREDGIKGFFKGVGATALRDAPFAGIYVVVYEKLKLLASKTVSSYQHNSTINLGCGVFAGFAATLITQPFDLVKTRIQLKPKVYLNTKLAFEKIYNDEGIRGFFKGTGPRLLRKTISSSLTWFIYEELILLYRQRNNDS